MFNIVMLEFLFQINNIREDTVPLSLIRGNRIIFGRSNILSWNQFNPSLLLYFCLKFEVEVLIKMQTFKCSLCGASVSISAQFSDPKLRIMLANNFSFWSRKICWKLEPFYLNFFWTLSIVKSKIEFSINLNSQI